MADGGFTRVTVQALASVDKTGATLIADQARIPPKLTDSQMAGAPVLSDGPVAEIVVKKKRGRPPRNPAVPSAAALAVASKRSKKEDEDVCFICFDGGNLVLCDRRDCPKAYHPACIKREESFFRPNIRWNCGWHLCNVCQRNALFMCYTCPYSLCKGCVKHADIFCVRGNKGFCKTCMSTIMLIEKIPQENKELVQVDFDDTTSWEYLFKVYWNFMKHRESLNVEELTKAFNPWNGSGLEHKNNYHHQIMDTCVNSISNVGSSNVHLEASSLKRRKTRGQSQLLNLGPQKVEKADGNEASCLRGNSNWASKELLEFVSHMKNGDVSVLSPFEVQTHLLEYIRANNLRDPRQKCQIICDRRLENLFGKKRVGHFEMLKLLEYHFKEYSCTNGVIRAAASDPLVGQVDTEGIGGDMPFLSREMRRQTRKNSIEKGQKNNLDSYAAIDVHNINLIYLKRSFLENLIGDAEKFHDKVVGSIVRIRISSADQKQDMHRLVRIIGTTKTNESYKIGDKMENTMLKILNLNKIEDITIDAISDQEFSEDECRRLRQSIKLGLVERITVGEIQEKARALQITRVSNWLETEITRLNHLRDRASEMGHPKDLREYLEKIELLQTPEERQRRLNEVPEVHADPRMDPSYGSDDDSGESDVKKRDGYVTPKYSNAISRGVELSSQTRTDASRDKRARTLKISSVNGERKRKPAAKSHVGKVEALSKPLGISQKRERDAASRVLEEHSNRADSIVGSGECDAASVGSDSPALVSGISEFDKIWHYRDPTGKVQGPFGLFLLRKWDSNGYFPSDLRLWRINDTEDQSILLTDALMKQPSEPHSQNHSSQSKDRAKSDGQNFGEEVNGNSSAPSTGCKPTEEGGNSNFTDIVAASDANEESTTTSDRSLQQVSDHPGGLGSSRGQHIIAQLVESLFSIEEPCSDAATATSPSPTLHMTPKTESSDPSSPTPKYESVDLENNAVEGASSSMNFDGPDSTTYCDVLSNGTEDINHMKTGVKSEPPDTVEQKHPVISNVRKDLSANWGTGSRSLDITDLSKTGSKTLDDHDMDNKHSTATVGHEHGSGISSTISCGIDVPVLPCAVSMEVEGLKCQASENKHPISSLVLGHGSRTSWNTASEVSEMPSTTQNNGLKALGAGDKHFSPHVPGPESGTTNWDTLSDVSGLPSVPANIPGQHYGTNWSTIPGGIGFSDLPSTLKLDDEALKRQAVETKRSTPENASGHDSCISWSTASTLVGEVHLPDVAGEWGAYSTVHTRPVVAFSSGLVGGSSVRLDEVVSDHATTTSDSCQLTLCSPTNPDWQPIELSVLGDESVSDLLSEVEAMESLRGMMNCGEDSMSPRDDCFSPLGGLSPNLDPGRNDALSSTADIQFHVQSLSMDRPFPVDIHDPPQISCVLTNPSPDLETKVKPAIVSTSLHDPVSVAPPPTLLPPPPPPTSPPPPPPPSPPPPSLPPPPPPPPPPSPPSLPPPSPLPPQKFPSPAAAQLPPPPSSGRSSSREEGEVDPASVPSVPVLQIQKQSKSMKMLAADTSCRQGSETSSTRVDTPRQENAKMSGSGSILGSPNMHWTTSHTSGNVNVNWNTSVASQDTRPNQVSPRYRHLGPKDRSHHHHVVDSGVGKSRQNSWNRPSSFGGGGGGSVRPHNSHRGQRICKFYESGYCKKGASCKYLHP